ncbi:MAG: type II toxin-antitoxin system RelE/ParE family toxin [Limisphaerales bacterium]
MPIRTLVIRNRGRQIIRAIATEAADGGKDPCPVLKFFQEQANSWPAEMTKLGARLAEISENGVPQPHDDTRFKKLGGTNELFEFKSSAQGLRLICFWDESLIICTHGYVKKGQKAPKSELERGERMRREYFESKAAGTLTHATA